MLFIGRICSALSLVVDNGPRLPREIRQRNADKSWANFQFAFEHSPFAEPLKDDSAVKALFRIWRRDFELLDDGDE